MSGENSLSKMLQQGLGFIISGGESILGAVSKFQGIDGEDGEKWKKMGDALGGGVGLGGLRRAETPSRAS